ncbi:MAG: hypothetical protein AB7U82_19760 [Blastocatellales bacterium]
MKKRTKITIETHQVQIIRRGKPSVQAWCPECSATVAMLTPEEAAALAQVTTRTIYHWVDAEELHFTETPEGMLLVCPDSLTNRPRWANFIMEKK